MAQYHGELFEILLDTEKMAACGEVRRCADKTCSLEGPDPTIFPNGELPMKKVVLDDTMEIVADFPKRQQQPRHRHLHLRELRSLLGYSLLCAGICYDLVAV